MTDPNWQVGIPELVQSYYLPSPISGKVLGWNDDDELVNLDAVIPPPVNTEATWCGTAGGSANAITLSPVTPLTSYVAGSRLSFIATAANTSSVTVAVSALTTKAVVTAYGAALSGGEIQPGSTDIEYDGTAFRVVNMPTFLQAGTGAVLRAMHNKAREFISVKDFGGLGDNSANESVAFETAPNNAMIYGGIYQTNLTPATKKTLITFGTTFTGSAPMDGWVPAFGSGGIRVLSKDANNAIIGATNNDNASGIETYPTGVTGYGRVNNQGNVVFAGFFRADLYAAGGGVATTEINSFNYGAAPAPGTGTTVNRGFGTTEAQPICITVGAGGNFDSTVGIHIVREGSAPRQFLNGITMEYDACKEYGLYIKSHITLGTDMLTTAVLQNVSNPILQMQHVGAAVPGNAFLTYFDNAAALKFGIRQSGKLIFGTGITQSTVGAAGAASALPSNPVGYIMFEVNGFEYVIPYYLKS